MTLADEIRGMVFAFTRDDGRREAVRELASRVEKLEMKSLILQTLVKEHKIESDEDAFETIQRTLSGFRRRVAEDTPIVMAAQEWAEVLDGIRNRGIYDQPKLEAAVIKLYAAVKPKEEKP